jgi:hypothetical protein
VRQEGIDDAMHDIECYLSIVYIYNGGSKMIDMKRKGKPGMVIDYLLTGVGGMVISLVALIGFVKLTGFGQTY